MPNLIDAERLARQAESGEYFDRESNTLAVVGQPDPNKLFQLPDGRTYVQGPDGNKTFVTQDQMNDVSTRAFLANRTQQLTTAHADRRRVLEASRDVEALRQLARTGSIGQVTEAMDDMRQEYGGDTLVQIPQWRQLIGVEQEYQQQQTQQAREQVAKLNSGLVNSGIDPNTVTGVGRDGEIQFSIAPSDQRAMRNMEVKEKTAALTARTAIIREQIKSLSAAMKTQIEADGQAHEADRRLFYDLQKELFMLHEGQREGSGLQQQQAQQPGGVQQQPVVAAPTITRGQLQTVQQKASASGRPVVVDRDDFDLLDSGETYWDAIDGVLYRKP